MISCCVNSSCIYEIQIVVNCPFRMQHKPENIDELKSKVREATTGSFFPSPSSTKKNYKDKNKKGKKDKNKKHARLLQERCVHCHEPFSEVNFLHFPCIYVPSFNS